MVRRKSHLSQIMAKFAPRSKQATNVCQKIGKLHSMRNRRSQPSKLKVTDKVTDQWNSNHAQVYPDRLTGYDVRTRLTEFKTFALSNRVASDNRLQTAVARTSDTNRQHLRPLTRNHLKPQAKRFGRDDNTASVTDAQRVRFGHNTTFRSALRTTWLSGTRCDNMAFRLHNMAFRQLRSAFRISCYAQRLRFIMQRDGCIPISIAF